MKDKAIRLLLIEDDKVDQMAFERAVKRGNLPYDYTIAGSVTEATEILKSTSFDVIISDYMLGDGTSFELFDLFKSTPVVVTTGSGDEDVAVNAMKFGACDYLIKDPEGSYLKVLPTTVELALKRKQNEDKLQKYQESLESMVMERTIELRQTLDSERSLSQIIEKSLNEIFIFDADSYKFLFVNNGARTNTGYSQAELLKMTPLDLKPEVDSSTFEEILAPLKKQQKENVTFETVHKRKDGSIYQVEIYLQKSEYRSRPVFVAIMLDVTQRKEISQRYQDLVEGTTDLITQVDGEGKFLYVNHMGNDLFGTKSAQLIGENALQFVHSEDRERTAAWLKDCQKNKISQGRIENRQVNPVTGDIHDLLWTAIFHYDEQGQFVSVDGIAKNITELKQLQDQLLQSQKMEAIGLMAGGMAHNFNNNLAIILGNVELAQIKLSEDSAVIDYLKNAKTAVLRSRDLIQQIMIFSRKENKDILPIQPALIINETLELLYSTIPSTVNLQQVISTNSHDVTIKADSSRIQEILLNLCSNAVHAMDEKGDLTISLDVIELQSQDIPTQSVCLPGRYAKLTVQDSGSGMTEETQQKIFDPFFTTKEVGEGTGMGLSTVYKIVEQYNGLIKVSSDLGAGTTFELYFPLVEQSQAEETITVKSDLPRGTEKILFVDDDEMLAQVGELILSEMGYRVVTMTESTEALKLFTANSDHFDLVITDQTMPGLSGKDLIQELLKIRPDLPTILCTGFSNKIDEDEAKELGISAFCMKPLDLPELLQTVRVVLDASKLSDDTD